MPEQANGKRAHDSERTHWHVPLIGVVAVGAFAAFIGLSGYLMAQGQDLGSRLNQSFSRASAAQP